MEKIIWICWLQGWEDAPKISKICLESWKYYNPDWDIRAIDRDSLPEYIDMRKYRNLSNLDNTAFADIFRLDLVSRHGGVWIDATAFCNEPLNNWLVDLVDDTFVFSIYEPDKICANWFIAAKQKSYIIDKWLSGCRSYQLEKSRGYDRYNGEYRWAHRVFFDLYHSDDQFKKAFDNMETIDVSHKDYTTTPPSQLDPGRYCHYFSPYRFGNNRLLTPESKKMIDDKVHPLYKLSRKMPIDWTIDSTLMYLLNSIPHQ